MPCHGARTPAPLSTHLSIKCKCTASQIETPISARAQQLISLCDNNIRATQWTDHQWDAEWADSPTRLRIFITDTGKYLPE